MRVDSNRSYAKILGLYICIDYNSFILGWFLLTRTRPFNLHFPAYNKYLSLFPGKFVKVLRVLYLTLKVSIIKRTRAKKNYDIVMVPYEGHILIETSDGYKIFNLSEKIVVSLFSSGFEEDHFIKIVRTLERVEVLNTSTRIKGVDYLNKCIYEEYINAYKADTFYPVSSYFYNKILPVWLSNVKASPRNKINLRKYVAKQEFFIFDRLRNLKKEGYDLGVIGEIHNFVGGLIKKIEIAAEPDQHITLTLSHGDLHAWNILLNNKNSVVLDWGTSQERTVFHDLFYMFYYNAFGGKVKDLKRFIVDLNKTLAYTQTNTDKEDNKYDLASCRDVYRMLFYLEYVQLDIEKRLNTFTDRNKIQSRLRKIKECITVFDEVEKVAGSRGV